MRVVKGVAGVCLAGAMVVLVAWLVCREAEREQTSASNVTASCLTGNQRLRIIDVVAFRCLEVRWAWPWRASLATDDVDAFLATRAKVSIVFAFVVLVTVGAALLLPGAVLLRERGTGRVQVALLAVAALALAVLACVEYGNAIASAAQGLGAWRILRLGLMVVVAAGHAAIVGGVIRATAALPAVRSTAQKKPTAPQLAGEGDREDERKHWALQFAARMCEEYADIMAARSGAPRRKEVDLPDERVTRRPCADLEIPENPTSAGEPFISFRAGDLTGLALSGGGIRSATFGLGMLQGLNRVGLLNKFDYLSTVSGGGYVGSFWSAWLSRRHESGQNVDGKEFPTVLDPRPPRLDVESNEVRHLREFGNFLAPRLGLFEVETWTAIVAILSGLIPAVLTALSLIGLALVAWLLTTIPLASGSGVLNAVTAALVAAAVLFHFERRWQLVKLPRVDRFDERVRARKRDLHINIGFGALAVTLVWGLMLLPAPASQSGSAKAMPAGWVLGYVATSVWEDADQCHGLDPDGDALIRRRGCWTEVGDKQAWWPLTGLAMRDAVSKTSRTPRRAVVGAEGDVAVVVEFEEVAVSNFWFASPTLFTYPMVWLVAGLLLLAGRHVDTLLPSNEPQKWVAPLDRTIMRLLGLALFGAAMALLWHVIVNLEQVMATALLTVTSAGGFALLRNWLGRTGRTPAAPGATSALKEAVPQLAAYLTVLLAAAGVGQLLVKLCGPNWFDWWLTFAAMSFVLLGGLFIDPGRFGLHAFYRSRISRAYAGASNLHPDEQAADNRLTESRPNDDLELAKLPPRPLHLICCAANDLSGDAVGTLGRNGRSAVLSRHGLSIGPFAGPTPGLTLGAAVTASAAAFNSNMGDVSTRFGPAVTFLMTALNLRLGLWVRHPAAERPYPRRWPGLLLYREFFGLTSASGEVAGRRIPSHLRDLHLSDGGHFENLGIYELVRRHCRYILVCDSGADPTVAFDDLGRAIRRIRQDFGVDISIDVEGLRPDDRGRSRQHLAIGRIHYSPTDAGILLYVKPTLTGDEPADVLQYKGCNHDFPHEGTGDQFYDEAQWESYRRLGLHIADTIFDFIPPRHEPASGAPSDRKADGASTATAAGELPATDPRQERQRRGEQVTADYAFAEAAHRWGPTPPGLSERVLEMTERVIEFETDLKSDGATVLLAEVFPELAHVPGSDIPGPDAREACTELVTILRVTQLMEDVWLACELDRWWAHPLNMGWTNFFARWATAPVFRFWWPVMGPMYSKGFRDFLDERFPSPKSRTATDEQNGLPWQGTVRQTDVRAPLASLAGTGATGVETIGPQEIGLALEWWAQRSAQPVPWSTDTPAPDVYFENVITGMRSQTRSEMQVGLAAIWTCAEAVLWTSDDFFVPPSLWGASIGWHFLEGLLNQLARDRQCKFVYVAVVRDLNDGGHRIAMDDRRSFVDQYRKIGFRQLLPKNFPEPATTLLGKRRILVDDLSAERRPYELDALLELELDAWTRRRGWNSTKHVRLPAEYGPER